MIGGGAFVVSCRFDLAGPQAGQHLDLLPPAARVRDGDASATLRWCVERMAAELRAPRPGGPRMAEHLAAFTAVARRPGFAAAGAEKWPIWTTGWSSVPRARFPGAAPIEARLPWIEPKR